MNISSKGKRSNALRLGRVSKVLKKVPLDCSCCDESGSADVVLGPCTRTTAIVRIEHQAGLKKACRRISQTTFQSWGRWIFSVLCTSMFMSYIGNSGASNNAASKPAFQPKSSKTKDSYSRQTIFCLHVQVNLRTFATPRETDVRLEAHSLTTTFLFTLEASSSSFSSPQLLAPSRFW